MPLELRDDDEISRCIIFERAFDHNIHINERLWIFDNRMPDGAAHESAVLRRLAPKDDDVHLIGCNIAHHQNENRCQPEPGPKRRYYCGFRTAKFDSLPKEGDGYVIEITHDPEGDNDAHVDVKLTLLVEGKSARRTRKTDASLALAEQFGSAIPYVCECDKGDHLHPLNQWGVSCLIGNDASRWGGVFVLPDKGEPSNDFSSGFVADEKP